MAAAEPQSIEVLRCSRQGNFADLTFRCRGIEVGDVSVFANVGLDTIELPIMERSTTSGESRVLWFRRREPVVHDVRIALPPAFIEEVTAKPPITIQLSLSCSLRVTS